MYLVCYVKAGSQILEHKKIIISMDLPNNSRQAWMSSSQLALVRCPRDIIDLFGVIGDETGLWNLWGRRGGETLDLLGVYPEVTLLGKKRKENKCKLVEEEDFL